MDHSEEIDLDDGSPFVDSAVEDLAPADYAGIVEEEVEATVRLDGLGDSFLEACQVSNVEKGGGRYTALALQSTRDLLGGLQIAVRCHHDTATAR